MADTKETLLLALYLLMNKCRVCSFEEICEVNLGVNACPDKSLIELPLKGPVSVRLEDLICLMHLHFNEIDTTCEF